MEYKYYLVPNVNNWEKIMQSHATKEDAFSSDLLSEHMVGSEYTYLIKGSFCKCLGSSS